MERIKTAAKRSYHKSRAHAGRVHRHPAGWPVVVFMLLLLASGVMVAVGLHRKTPHLTVHPDKNHIVIVSMDGQKQTVPTNEPTVRNLLKQLDVSLRPGDRVEPDLETKIVQDNLLINVYRAVPVAIQDGGRQIITKTAAATGRSKAKLSGVLIYPEDRVAVRPIGNFLFDQTVTEVVAIDRATPVAMNLYGTPLTVRTHTKDVAALLKEKNINLSKDDTVKPSLSEKITPNMQVTVVRNGIQVITIDEDVAPPVKTIVDTSLSFGSQAVRQEGVPGKVKKTYEVNIQKGEEVSRKLLQSVTVTEAVPRIVAKGNTVNIPADKQAVLAAAGVSPSDYMYVDYIFAHESGWNAAVMSANGKYAGLGQTNPATLSNACPNWQSDPVCQTRFFSGYAAKRYGGWSGAYSTWQAKGWW